MKKRILSILLILTILATLLMNVGATTDRPIVVIIPELQNILDSADETDLIPVWIIGITKNQGRKAFNNLNEIMGFEREFQSLVKDFPEYDALPGLFVTFQATPAEIMTLYNPTRAVAVFPFYGQKEWNKFMYDIHNSGTDCPTCKVVHIDCNCAICISERGYEIIKEYTIFDALEILKYLAGIDNTIDGCISVRASSMLTESSRQAGEPTIFDVLEILKILAGM